jgi:hypothetical protein
MTAKLLDMIAVSTFRTKGAAQIAKRMLDEVGIESVIRPDPMIVDRLQDPTINRRYANYNDHVQLMVMAADADKARAALHGPQ